MPSAEQGAVLHLGAGEAARRLQRGDLSAVALVEACLARIKNLDGQLEAWVHVDEVGALAAARQRDAEARAGRSAGALHGVPVGIKDIFDVAGMPTRAGARPFAHRRPEEDAVSVARLRRAGAIVLGKTATTQFAYRDPAPTRNPWNPDHTPGGSSSGSAAAVAARMIPLALGSQTVGSVLRPAAYCGLVGLKGSHGLVPVEGVVPLAWSLDHVGVFARSVADGALALALIAERAIEPPAAQAPRLALAPELLRAATPEVAEHLRALTDRLQQAGAKIVEVSLPPAYAEIHETGRVVLEAEAAAYHEKAYAGRAADFGEQIGALVRAGLRRSAAEYIHANRARLAFRDAVTPLLAAHDALLSPTAPGPAPKGLTSTGDASLCAPWSFAGVPAITLPSGVNAAGLPLAVQLVAAAGQEARLLGAARWCENVLAFSAAPPPAEEGRGA